MKKEVSDKRKRIINIASMIFAIVLFVIVLAISYDLHDAGMNPVISLLPGILYFILFELSVMVLQGRFKKISNAAEEYYEMIEGLTKDSDTIVKIDLDNNTAIGIKLPPLISQRYEEEMKKGADSFRTFFVEQIVSPDNRDYVRPLFDTRTMMTRLATEEQYLLVFNIHYRDMSRHHYEAKVMRIGDFEKKHQVIIAIRCIDKQEIEESILRRHLEDSVSARTAELKEKNERLNRLNEDIIGFLGNIVEARDVESGEHVRRVKGFTHILAEQVMNDYPEYNLTPSKVDLITSASALHDLGKITIPDAILLKPGRLSEDEFETMKKHSEKGCEILQLAPMDWSEEYLKTSVEICKYHHEKYDGKGYPEGLKGDEIPISAQIVSVVDCLDALLNKRVYKEALSFDLAYEMILGGECGAFSPKILDCFVKCREKFEKHALDKSSNFSNPELNKTEEAYLIGITILLVEDEEMSSEVTRDMLEGNGATVIVAKSGKEALDFLNAKEREQIDAILMDLFMPGIDGFETAKAIRGLKLPGAETVPIIAVSVSHSDVDIGKATDAGMNAYLFKPVTASQLSRALMHCLKDKANTLQKKLTKTSRVAHRDTLTGVRSMSAYMDKVEELKDIMRKEEPSFALVECDLNGLKGVNDTFGHDIGDIYIVNCCKAICNVFKHSPVYRIGGDEFIVVLQGEDFDNRESLMTRLRETLFESKEKEDPVHGRISIAAGMADYVPGTDKTVGDVLKRADTSMYNNKKMMHLEIDD